VSHLEHAALNLADCRTLARYTVQRELDNLAVLGTNDGPAALKLGEENVRLKGRQRRAERRPE
jgi:hypothetical protein